MAWGSLRRCGGVAVGCGRWCVGGGVWAVVLRLAKERGPEAGSRAMSRFRVSMGVVGRFEVALALAVALTLGVEGIRGVALAQAPAAPGASTGAPAQDAVPKVEDFLSVSPDGKTVRIVMVSAFNGANYGMNFNGFAKGGAKYVVPVGADVEVTFTNRSPVPHSVVVVEKPQVKRLQMGDPAFEGAATPNPVRGTTGTKGETFRFKATEAGDYAFACGFPSHAANGHWIALEVSDKATVPSLQFGEAAPFTPKPSKP